nr:cytochrome P450 [Pharsalia antennata]
MAFCYNENSLFNYLEENKLISFITSFTFLIIFIFIFILKAYTFFDKRRIPRAVHPTAPFGNIKDILFQETTLYVYLWKYYNKFKRKGFKYGGLYLFFKPSILVVDSAIMQIILTEQTFLKDVHRKHYQKNNKVMDFFTEDNLENFVIRYNNTKNTSLRNLNEKCISTVLHNFFMDTTSSAFGFKMSLQDFPAVNELLNKKTSSGFKYYFNLVYPLFERNIYPDSKMQDLIMGIVEYRKKRDLREIDLIQAFIDSYNNGDYNLNEMILDIFDIFVDNTIYACSTLLFCLYELASNKDIQKNLIQELEKFKEKNKSIQLKDLQELSYLDAVIKETLRKYPPVPVIFKKCKEYYKIDGIDLELPKGTFILYSIMGVHYDPLNYLEPGKFYPGRFLKEFNKIDIPNVYIPFGLDIWKEMGFRFTVLHIKLGLISIFSSYSVNLSSQCTVKFDNKKVPIYPEEPLPINFVPLLK